MKSQHFKLSRITWLWCWLPFFVYQNSSLQGWGYSGVHHPCLREPRPISQCTVKLAFGHTILSANGPIGKALTSISSLPEQQLHKVKIKQCQTIKQPLPVKPWGLEYWDAPRQSASIAAIMKMVGMLSIWFGVEMFSDPACAACSQISHVLRWSFATRLYQVSDRLSEIDRHLAWKKPLSRKRLEVLPGCCHQLERIVTWADLILDVFPPSADFKGWCFMIHDSYKICLNHLNHGL